MSGPNPKTWSQVQRWDNLLFAHWPIAPDVMRAAIPDVLELDTFDGQAWLGLVPFQITGWRFRFLPPIPGLTDFPELNLRTYVNVRGKDRKPGVYFFSLDAAHFLAVVGARIGFSLPYFHATMNVTPRGEGAEAGFDYHSTRTHRGAPPAQFVGSYRPTSSPRRFPANTLDYWLTERYCLYAVTPNKTVLRANIDHPQWELQPAEAEIQTNTVTSQFKLPDVPPLLHFSLRQTAYIWLPHRVM